MSTEGITRMRRRGAVVIDNNTVYDTSMSYSALGVLAVLLARPDDAPKGYRTLMRPEAGVGQKAVLAAFRELREAGYRYQFLRNTTSTRGRNKVVTDTYISEQPISLEEAKRWHFESTGEVAIDMPERRSIPKASSKDTLASLSDAHESDAHSSAAHERGAQDKNALPAAGSAHSSPAAEISLSDQPEQQHQQPPANLELPPLPPSKTSSDDATSRHPFGITPEQAAINAQGAARVREAMRRAAEQAAAASKAAEDDK